MLKRTRGRLVHGGGQPRAAALRDDDAVRTDALGRADDRAEIVRVGDFVTQHEKRRLTALGGDGEHVLDRAVLLDGAQRDHALMCVRLAHGVELAAVGLHHHDARGQHAYAQHKPL